MTKILKLSIKIIINFYRIFISPLIFNNNCRYYPSCSKYALLAIEKYGIFLGLRMILVRILKCHPFGNNGGVDYP
nr:membrane protein insertion efficiency factor YidD [Lyticum sinuosum]